VTGPLRVGLVGAGPWARMVHAPMIAGHPGTELAGVWARRAEAAAEVAGAHSAPVFPRYEELLDACDAVAFAVPPDVQAMHAVTAARAGKALLLEKPVALDRAGAERLADAVGAAGVGSQILLTWRYSDAVRAFLAGLAPRRSIGGRAWFLGAGSLGGDFATPWRLARGHLLDLGPHVLDLLDAALGPIVGVRAHGDVHRWTGLLLEHTSGAVSEASMSAVVPVEPHRSGAEVATEDGLRSVDTAGARSDGTLTAVMDDFVRTAAGRPHALDVQRGLHLQRLLDTAGRQLRDP
jgi:predicted dehydrogenase